MSTLTSRPMRLLIVEFDELYARHLCRHSQFGINVAHLTALFVTWYAAYGLLYWLTGIEWLLAVPAVAYLAPVALNVPLRIFLTTALFLGLIIAAAMYVPAPWWANLVMIPAAYKLQSWSHKIYTVEFDMTEFNRKYTKGSVLFVILLIYEVPIVSKYLLFSPRTQPVLPGPVHANQDMGAATAS